jgi:hypothetical protein
MHPKLGTKPGIAFILLGMGELVLSACVSQNLISGILGIILVTTIWDDIVFYRQEKRAARGQA